jgi:hypothetical protein
MLRISGIVIDLAADLLRWLLLAFRSSQSMESVCCRPLVASASRPTRISFEEARLAPDGNESESALSPERD